MGSVLATLELPPQLTTHRAQVCQPLETGSPKMLDNTVAHGSPPQVGKAACSALRVDCSRRWLVVVRVSGIYVPFFWQGVIQTQVVERSTCSDYEGRSLRLVLERPVPLQAPEAALQHAYGTLHNASHGAMR